MRIYSYRRMIEELREEAAQHSEPRGIGRAVLLVIAVLALMHLLSAH
jgi:hypothetical protein